MGNYKRGDNFGGNKRFNNDRGSRGGGRSDRPTMHQATCSDCGKDCEVPFKPTGSKPVFCSDCFGKKGDSGSSRFERRDSGRSSFGDKQMFKTVCDKCGKDCEVPFKPSGDKPVFCSDCFGKGERSGGSKNTGSPDKLEKQFEMLNSKLDDILRMLSPKTSAEKTVKPSSAPSSVKTSAGKKASAGKKVATKPSSAKASAGKKKKATPKKAPKKTGAKKKK